MCLETLFLYCAVLSMSKEIRFRNANKYLTGQFCWFGPSGEMGIKSEKERCEGKNAVCKTINCLFRCWAFSTENSLKKGQRMRKRKTDSICWSAEKKGLKSFKTGTNSKLLQHEEDAPTIKDNKLENFAFIFSFPNAKLIYIFRESIQLAREKLIIVSFSARDNQGEFPQWLSEEVEELAHELIRWESLAEEWRGCTRQATNAEMRYKIHPFTFPGRKFQLHSSSIIALYAVFSILLITPTGMFSHKNKLLLRLSLLRKFSPEEVNKILHVLEAFKMRAEETQKKIPREA